MKAVLSSNLSWRSGSTGGGGGIEPYVCVRACVCLCAFGYRKFVCLVLVRLFGIFFGLFVCVCVRNRDLVYVMVIIHICCKFCIAVMIALRSVCGTPPLWHQLIANITHVAPHCPRRDLSWRHLSPHYYSNLKKEVISEITL